MSNIKINDVFQRIQYAATNGQTQFAIPFPFFQNAYVVVWQDGIVIDQGAGAGEYLITGAGSPSGGDITLVTPAPLDSIITIEGIMPIDRTSIYSATISNLTGSDLNGDFNREVVMMKQIQTNQALLQIQYAPWAVISQDQAVTKDRYIPLLLPLEAWRMNAAGTAIETFQTPSSGGLAPDDGTYLVQTADADLPDAIALDELASGIMVNKVGTGLFALRSLAGVTNQTVVTNGNGISGNPTTGIAPNPIIPGTEGMGIPFGTTAERPGSPSGTELRFNTDLDAIEYWDGTLWVQLSDNNGVLTAAGTLNQILVNGGIAPVDGATVFSLSTTLNLPGSFNIQGTNAVTAIINDSSMATATTSNLSSSAAIKAYVDSLVTGLSIQGSCVCASTVALTATYGNGASGVGATLTNGGVQAAISLDGVSPTVGQRVLIKNQASTFQNGIYTVTIVGSGATNWVLTRASDYDTPADIAPGDLVILTGGTTQTQSSWVETAMVATIGTDPVIFVQFTASLPVNVPSGGTGVTSFTAYSPIVGGTTTTGSLQSISLGVAGTLYQSAGVGALPGFTTTTYPATNAINTIMYASSANVLGSIAAANSSVMITSGAGVPSMSTTLPSGISATNMHLTTPSIDTIMDTNAKSILGFSPAGASAVNYLILANSIAAAGPSFQAAGTDANIGITFQCKAASVLAFASSTLANYIVLSPAATLTPVTASAQGTDSNVGFNILSKGTGQVTFQSINASPVIIQSGTALQHTTTFAIPNTATSRTVTFPDASFTLSTSVISTQIFTSGSGTYTPTAGALYVWVRAVAGGGQGGGALAGSTQVGVGAGGGAGGYGEIWEAATSRAYSVGAGGSTGTTSTGQSGTATTFGTAGAQLNLAGGTGGSSQNSQVASAVAAGGAGGASTTATFGVAGMKGRGGLGGTSFGTIAGDGGPSPFGGNGMGAVQNSAGGVAGSAATGPGSGGGGAGAQGANSANGGAGGSGYIIITEYA